MKDLFIKKCMGILVVACEDPQDTTCNVPLCHEEAVQRMMLHLPRLGLFLQAGGPLTRQVTAALINFGGLALAAIATGAGKPFVDAARDVQNQLLADNPSVSEMQITDWGTLEPSFGYYHHLVDQVLAAKAMCIRTDLRDTTHPAIGFDDLNGQLRSIIQTVFAWFWFIAVSLGEEQDEQVAFLLEADAEAKKALAEAEAVAAVERRTTDDKVAKLTEIARTAVNAMETAVIELYSRVPALEDVKRFSVITDSLKEQLDAVLAPPSLDAEATDAPAVTQPSADEQVAVAIAPVES